MSGIDRQVRTVARGFCIISLRADHFANHREPHTPYPELPRKRFLPFSLDGFRNPHATQPGQHERQCDSVQRQCITTLECLCGKCLEAWIGYRWTRQRIGFRTRLMNSDKPHFRGSLLC
jgi:hypothetical protein